MELEALLFYTSEQKKEERRKLVKSRSAKNQNVIVRNATKHETSRNVFV